jgi:2-dehydro-3-deoxyphosphogluconate aldolase / (4S)-4-hydroxy-2-oxoglutarate aldolase
MKEILEQRVVSVVVIDQVENAVPMAEALLAGGLSVMEITFRTSAAEESIRRICKALPNMICGAGTLLTPDQIVRAQNAGARFGVSPGFNPKVAAQARDIQFPFYPGVLTPSDVEAALEMGCTLMKFFPAEPSGGVKMLKAMAAPYAHTGIRFIPLGGINPANAPEYFQLPSVAAIGGTWIADAKLIKEKKWAEITRNAREIVDIAAQYRC